VHDELRLPALALERHHGEARRGRAQRAHERRCYRPLEILDARRMRIDALTITQADVDALLAGQPAGAVLTVRLGDGAAEVKLKRFPGEARVAVRAGTDEAPLTLQVDQVRVAGVPIPDLFVDWLVRNFDPTLRLKGLPVPVSLGRIRILPGRIEIGAPPSV